MKSLSYNRSCFGIKTVALGALICLSIASVSCRTIKETEYVTITERVHDTVEMYVHDTTKVVDVRHDSIDRYVEKIKYVDTNGVVHEKEIERLTRYIKESSEEYKVRESEYKRRISELEQKEKEAVKEILVEKPLAWWQKTLMYLGAFLIIGSLFLFVLLIVKTKR